MSNNPGNRPLSLAAHLRRAASLLRSGSFDYQWQSTCSCNCGLVARIITGKSGAQIEKALKPFKVYPPNGQNSWKHMVQRACPITGVPENVFFRQLHEAGMTFEDFNHLERQSNPAIVEMVAKHYTRTLTERRWWGGKRQKAIPAETKPDDEDTLPAYLDCWASLIEDYNKAHPAATAEDQRLDAIESRPLVS